MTNQKLDKDFTDFWHYVCTEVESSYRSQLLNQKLNDNEIREIVGSLKAIERVRTAPEWILRKSQSESELKGVK